MSNVAQTPNIGKELALKLAKADIKTPEELFFYGSKSAFIKIKTIFPEAVCINMLYALEGAVQNIRWHGLDKNCKQDLLELFKADDKQ